MNETFLKVYLAGYHKIHHEKPGFSLEYKIQLAINHFWFVKFMNSFCFLSEKDEDIYTLGETLSDTH